MPTISEEGRGGKCSGGPGDLPLENVRKRVRRRRNDKDSATQAVSGLDVVMPTMLCLATGPILSAIRKQSIYPL